MAPRGKASEQAEPAAHATTKLGDFKSFSTSVPSMVNYFGATPAPHVKPPVARPPFTVKDVRGAIPAHCFKRSALISGWHLLKDLATIAAFGYAATHIDRAPEWARVPLWAAYIIAQGFVMTGVWVIAHECGHQSFSDSKFINDTVGWFAHSALLVPYHSWRISHSKHHKNTCSVEDDEVFAAASRSDWKDMTEETPLAAAFGVFVMLFFGWPAYIIGNFAGPAKYAGKPNSHFQPHSVLYSDDGSQYAQVLISDFGFFTALGAVGYAISVFGFAPVALFYLLPYLVVNANLVMITYLQHTDAYVPHYREGEFDWLRGALSTVDRSYGWLVDSVFHHITDTHVVHHMFHEMPWYHAEEATYHVRAVLGDYYLADHTPAAAALWRSWRECKFVDDKGGYLYFKNFAGEKGKAGKTA